VPRRKRNAAPPGLAEDPAQLAAEASAAPAGPTDGPARNGKKIRAADRQLESGGPGSVAPPPTGGEVIFPVEAIAAVHADVWKALARRMRSRYQLSPEGAQEMARYAEVCIRQYLGPLLAQHAALAAYLMTQGTALVALLALREEPEKKPQPLPESGVARAAAQSTG